VADRGGEGKKMKRVVMARAGGDGSASAVARGHDAARWPCSSSSSSPSLAGHGGEGNWGLEKRSVAYSLFLKSVLLLLKFPSSRTAMAARGWMVLL
jgi:hypothetical protein